MTTRPDFKCIIYGSVVQLAKTPVCHIGEHGFNPRRSRQFRRFCLDFATRSKIKGIKNQSGRGLYALHNLKYAAWFPCDSVVRIAAEMRLVQAKSYVDFALFKRNRQARTNGDERLVDKARGSCKRPPVAMGIQLYYMGLDDFLKQGLVCYT